MSIDIKIPGFELIEEIGSGGISKVYLGMQILTITIQSSGGTYPMGMGYGGWGSSIVDLLIKLYRVESASK